MAESQAGILRAMALNYTKRHSWDHLDTEACTKAADEILALRASLQQVTAERDAETQRANGAVIRAGVLDMARSNLSYHYHQALDAATNDDLPADLTLTLAERVTRYRDRWLAANAELARLRAEGEALRAALNVFADMDAMNPPKGVSLNEWLPAVTGARAALREPPALARAATAREGQAG